MRRRMILRETLDCPLPFTHVHTRESPAREQHVKGLFCGRSDYEEMPLQNGQAIRAKYKEESDSD